MKFEFTAARIAQALDGVVDGDENAKIVRVSKIEEGREGSITFLANPKYTPYIYTTNATAIVCSKTFVPEHPISSTLIRVDDPYSSFTKLLETTLLLFPYALVSSFPEDANTILALSARTTLITPFPDTGAI